MIDELERYRRQPGPRCSIGKLQSTHSDLFAEIVEAREAGFEISTITRYLAAEHDLTVSTQQLARHLRGSCTCP